MTERTAVPLPTGNRARIAPIVKAAAAGGMTANLRDYERACTEFSWAQARSWLDGLPGGRGLNIAHEAIDRHTAGGNGNRLALRWIGRKGVRRNFTYGSLRYTIARSVKSEA